jgi:hypothetical protein
VEPEINIEFNQSAFDHSITEANIRWALAHPRYEGLMDGENGEEDKYIVIAFDTAGNLLEIMYNLHNETTVYVFHAMKCRSIYYHLLYI